MGEKNITIGTAVTGSNSSIQGYYDKSLYINSNTYILWECDGTKWVNRGVLKGANGAAGANGNDGVSLTATSTKSGKTTTVLIKNASTGAVIDTLTIQDGTDGSGSGDMTKSEYASSKTGVVKQADKLSDDAGTFEVNTSSKQNGDALIYDSATGKWKNGKVSTDVDQTYNASSTNAQSGTAVASAISGKISDPSTKSANQVLKYNGSEWAAADESTGAEIDDSTISTEKVWSSNEVKNRLDNKAYKSQLDTWHQYNNAKEVIAVEDSGESTITFHEIDTRYSYKLFADTSDGSMVTVKSSVYTESRQGYDSSTGYYGIGTLAFTVNVSTVPANFALRKIKI